MKTGKSGGVKPILAATDPVLCDAYVCHFMGYEVEEVPVYKNGGSIRGRGRMLGKCAAS